MLFDLKSVQCQILELARGSGGGGGTCVVVLHHDKYVLNVTETCYLLIIPNLKLKYKLS